MTTMMSAHRSDLSRLFRAMERIDVPFAHTGHVSDPNVNEPAPTLEVTNQEKTENGPADLPRFLIDKASGTINNMSYIYYTKLADLGLVVKFDGLTKLLSVISSSLLHGRTVSAELRMIQIYQPGVAHETPYSTFKQYDDHILTLCITCGGDWTHATGGGDIIFDRRSTPEKTRWVCHSPGSYGCWYPHEQLRTSRVEGEKGSYRVVFVYCVRLAESGVKRKISDNVPWISQPESSLSSLSDEIGARIVAFLGSREICKLSRSCKQLKRLGTRALLLKTMIRQCKDEIMTANRGRAQIKSLFATIALPLQWSYRPHGSNQFHFLGRALFGSDFELFLALKDAFPKADVLCHETKVRRQVVGMGQEEILFFQGERDIEEHDYDNFASWSNFFKSRQGIDYIIPKSTYALHWGDQDIKSLVSYNDDIREESVDPMEYRCFFPFFRTVHLTGRTYLAKILGRLEGYEGVEMGGDNLDYYETSSLLLSFPLSEQEINEERRSLEIFKGSNNDLTVLSPEGSGVWFQPYFY